MQSLIKPNRFTYTSPYVPITPQAGAATAKPAEVSPVPGLATPEQMQERLLTQGGQIIDQGVDAYGRGAQIGIDSVKQLDPIQREQARIRREQEDASYGRRVGTFVSGTKDLSNNAFGNALQVAQIQRELAQGTTGAVSGAISGEQSNDAARLQLMREVLMKPKSFGQHLGELTSAIAPIAALLIA